MWGANRLRAAGRRAGAPEEEEARHNWPGLAVGEAAVHDGPVMAAFDVFTLRLTGRGCHAAMPHLGTDVVLAACQLANQLQGLISRETPPHQSAVLSITQFHAGDAYNVIPETVELRGTVRCFDAALKARLEQEDERMEGGGRKEHDGPCARVECDYLARKGVQGLKPDCMYI